jgi:hypothetical protein
MLNNSKSPVSILVFGILLMASQIVAQNQPNHGTKFEQLGPMLASPNEYRDASGAPGPNYWQQQADYVIECTLDVDNQRLDGSELITYHNNSPNTLKYIWLQLDENQHAADANNQRFEPSRISPAMSEDELRSLEPWRELEKFGVNIEAVTLKDGAPLDYSINKTMMRILLPAPLKSGESFSFSIKWHYYLIDRINSVSWGRGGYEYFPKDDNYLFTITQWYPRMCVYSDFEGWQNNQFTGRGEFALNFGNFDVKMTLPEDYVVGSTGNCQNYSDVLTPTQLKRWKQAQSSSEPVEVVTLEDAKTMETAKRSAKLKTWHYKAENVRDFAWTASRKFIWDAMSYPNEGGEPVMCMSYYPKEAYPIYRKYSTKAVAHTLKTYSKYSIPYPYPVAISVEADNGMEYPMICFNPERAEEDGTYTEAAKLEAISVIIHEVGHNYFPMIINSDERQWAWFDEGINTFIEYIAEQEWDNHYKSWIGPEIITDYMSLPKEQLEPIMTNTENIVHYFDNAYLKPAAALNILRETIMGREQFDFAFREYCRRWAFKHPTPADFFRTMEDASGYDLDWFWKGWFYTTDAVDISLDSINWYKVDLENNPERKEDIVIEKNEPLFQDITRIRNREEGMVFPVQEDESLQDFYNDYQPWETEDSITTTTTLLYEDQFTKKEKKKQFGKNNYYELFFSNKGGLVMPVIIEWTFEDGSTEIERVPVEIWRKNEHDFQKVFVKDKVVTAIRIDPLKETFDINLSNNDWPVRDVPTRFEVFRKHQQKEQLNPMQKAKKKGIKP